MLLEGTDGAVGHGCRVGRQVRLKVVERGDDVGEEETGIARFGQDGVKVRCESCPAVTHRIQDLPGDGGFPPDPNERQVEAPRSSEVLRRQTALAGLGEEAKPAEVGARANEMEDVQAPDVSPELVDLGFERNVGCGHTVRSLMENTRKAGAGRYPKAVSCR